MMGVSKNGEFFVRAGKSCAENRSAYVMHEGLSTGLTQLSRKKYILRDTQTY